MMLLVSVAYCLISSVSSSDNAVKSGGNGGSDTASNIALKKEAYQSTLHSSSGAANHGTDGNKITNFFKSSCTHTLAEKSPWWKVDLGNMFEVREVIVVNRGDCCADRITGFYVHVGNTGTRSDPRCGDKLDNKDFVNSVRHVKCELEGRWISIHHENRNGGDKILTICELEAYGVAVNSGGNDGSDTVCKIPGQVFNKCGSACTKTCEDPNPICTKQCVSKCECPGDKPILHEGKCIAQAQCNPIPECKIPGQVFNKCGSACTRTCDDSSPICTKQCVSKCECPGGMPILHENRCIEQAECPVNPEVKIMIKPQKDVFECKKKEKGCKLIFNVVASKGSEDIAVLSKNVKICTFEGENEIPTKCKKVGCSGPNFCRSLKALKKNAGQYVAVVTIGGVQERSVPVTLNIV